MRETFPVDPGENFGRMSYALMPFLLIVLFGIVLTIGLFFIYLSTPRARSARDQADSLSRGTPLAASEADAYRALRMREPLRWLAIRSGNLTAVQEVLRLTDPTPCTWMESLSRSEDRALFVSPPVFGWILVFGNDLPDPVDDPDLSYHFLVRISEQLGEAHFYSANRVVNHHAWVRAERGRIIRAYAWAGQTLWNQGRMTSAEHRLGLRCHDYGAIAAPTPEGFEMPEPSNSEKILQLAGCWSIDPTRVDESVLYSHWGVTGGLSLRKFR